MDARWFEHEEVSSTSDVAFEALAAGTARHGDVHTARVQTAGRGRRGRTWHQMPGEGLALSLVWLPPAPAPSPAGLTMAAGLGLHDCCAELGLRGGRLKWPNDLLAAGGKLAGVLVESRGLDPGAPHYVVGVGLNVRQSRFSAELEAEQPVTSLLREGLDVPLRNAAETLREALAGRLAQVTTGPARLTADYLTALGLAGAAVDVTVGSKTTRGRLAGIDLGTGLTLEADAGTRQIPLEHITRLCAV